MSATIKNKDGEIKYRIHGRYAKELFCTNVSTGKTFSVFKAPEFPVYGHADKSKIYGMNLMALQLNNLPENL